jgi:hypothetical protein
MYIYTYVYVYVVTFENVLGQFLALLGTHRGVAHLDIHA